eukprot:COSAG06_NODE_64860_length_258_cov_0.955975_1_plen_25_part_10
MIDHHHHVQVYIFINDAEDRVVECN